MDAAQARYEKGVRDVVFIAVVVGFFVLAAVFVRACDAVLGPGADTEVDAGR